MAAASGKREAALSLGLLLVCLVAVVGLSRLYLQVHFPTDVLFGIVCGVLWVWLLHRLPVWRRV